MAVKRLLVVVFFLLLGSVTLARAGETRLLRFPDVYKDQVVFVYAGDLWIASTSGGQARRLTADDGMELFPKFSPDGKYIAFTADYDGNRDVYVIPAEGGEPKRLTWSPEMSPAPAERMGPDNLVLGWTPDSKRIVYRSRRTTFNAWVGQLYTVGLEGGLPQQLPVPRGGYTSYSPDGSKIAYNRIFREFRTWKRYRGGQADDIWIYDLKSGALENITNNEAQDVFPMWTGNKIYFWSDRDKTANLFAYDLKSKQTKKVTDFTEYDVKYPSLGNGAIAFENAGSIYLLDLATEKTRKLSLELNDERRLTRTEFLNPRDRITETSLSPDGKRALFVARGEIFTVPAEKGNTRNLTNSSGAREKAATWSPDGKYIGYISDVTGEDELYLVTQDGSAPAVRLTTDGSVQRGNTRWSPDSKKLAFTDKSFNLWYVDVETKKVTKVAQSSHGNIFAYDWSPDSKWIAYARPELTEWNSGGFSVIYLYALADGKSHPVTDALTTSGNPTFDPSGKYLFFTSSRDLNATVGAFEWNYAYLKPQRLFCVTLQAETPSPFAPESDEVKIGSEKKPESEAKSEAKPEGEKKEEKKDVKIDLDGIKGRIVGLTMPPGNYGALTAARDKIFYLSFPTFSMTGAPSERVTLRVYELDKKKDSELFPVDGYDISANGEKMLIASGGGYSIVDARPGVRLGEGSISLNGMQMKLDRKAEWKQIFEEAWRLERDFFYVENMHGLDWKKIHDRYAVLLPFVSHRADLSYLIGEMIGELNIGHAYVGGGDMPRPRTVRLALLGCDFEEAGGFIRIRKILEGENWNESRRSPLTEPGVVVKEGDYLLAIDGVELKASMNPYALLENKLGTTITLKVNSKPSLEGARDIKVRPIASETDLRYFNWVEGNRRYVEQKTGGKVGYIHIPDMGGTGLNEFVKYYYPQVRKEGLIVDDRYNGGGNVSQMVIERLRRVLGAMNGPRDGEPLTYPSAIYTGPLVCMLNEFSASDGDIFPAMFRQYKLGKLIGKRSWGGVVGINGQTPLVDGGYVSMPTSGQYNITTGNWHIEGHGVDPDIVVDNPPLDEFNGKDAQLDRAIEEILKEMKDKPATLPKKPAPPVKN
ncbi:MAG: PDZ domain-containing protein [Blastocatellia bacterium]|nr:PDZ domain-containing protein [Blastocatellia bacterium]